MYTLSLEGQTAVITGGSRGIGRAIAETLAQAGANIVVNYNRTPADDLVEYAKSLGVKATAVQADVSQVGDCEKIVAEAISVFGRIDVLVNNAGITKDTLLLRMSDEDWQAVIDTNLRSVFACCRAALKPMLKARTGSIINISSVSGLTGLAGQANYAASKAGMIGFTKSLAREAALRGIRANVIAPGFIKSDMTAVLDEKTQEKVLGEIPLGQFGEAKDIANTVLFLASPLSRYITGTVTVVDGGLTM